jgi:hypothetical protein
MEIGESRDEGQPLIRFTKKSVLALWTTLEL